jgi:hypothetical protein
MGKMRRVCKIGWTTSIIVPILFLVAVVGGWELKYWSESDPKNIKYVIWKTGLYRMNLDSVTGTMIGDPSREKLILIIGKTKSELRKRFGYL